MDTRKQKKIRREEADDAVAESTKKTARPSTPKEPRIWPVPDMAKFHMFKMTTASKGKADEKVLVSMKWDIDFEKLLDEVEDHSSFSASFNAKGSWESSTMIDVTEGGRGGMPASRLKTEEDWEAWKDEFRTKCSTTGKIYHFKLLFFFKPSFPTLATRLRELEEPASNSQISADFRASSEALLTPEFDTTPRQSTTSRREALLTDPIRLRGQNMLKIERAMACDEHEGSFCYVPVSGLPHVKLGARARRDWCEALEKGLTTEWKPPRDLPELIQWAKDFGGTSKSKTPKTAPEETTPVREVHHYYSPQSALQQPVYAQSYGLPTPVEAPRAYNPPVISSPALPEDAEAQGGSFATLRAWMVYAVSCHKDCSGVNLNEVIDNCRKNGMSYLFLRDILKKADLKPWIEVREVGIVYGLALAMHLELKAWEHSKRPYYAQNTEND